VVISGGEKISTVEAAQAMFPHDAALSPQS
jgi:hypothetical protein